VSKPAPGPDPRVKGSDLVVLRKLFSERPPEDLQRFLSQLNAQDRDGYENALHITWLPADMLTRIYIAAAPIFFPTSASALRQLGQLLATSSFSTVYKLVLAVPSLHFVVRRASIVWSSYHDLGKATIEDQSEHALSLVVRGTPKLMFEMRELIAGHILALARATNTKNARVEVVSDDPNAWRWRITWR
jgi:hypothetical protein